MPKQTQKFIYCHWAVASAYPCLDYKVKSDLETL